jgi:hypothetical protein
VQECLGTLGSEDRSSMRLPPLNAVRVCAAAAVILTFVASPASSQSNQSTQGEPVAACQKELARSLVNSLIHSGFVKGGTIVGSAYKGFKLSNSLEQKDVSHFLKIHGMTDPETIQRISSRVIHFVRRGKIFRRGMLSAMVIGAAVVVLEFLPPEYQPGSHANANEVPKHGPDVIVAPKVDREDDFNRISPQFEASLNQKFGEKSELAALLLALPGLEECARRSRPNLPTDLILRCNLEHKPKPVCLLEDPRIVDTTKEILSQVSYENGELSGDMGDF